MRLTRADFAPDAGQDGVMGAALEDHEDIADEHTPAPLTNEEEVALRLRRIEELNARLTTEPLDRRWARESESQFAKAYSTSEFDGVQTEVDCGSTLCRAKFAFDPSSDFGDIRSRWIVTRAPWRGKGFARISRSEGSAVFFLAREGLDLSGTAIREVNKQDAEESAAAVGRGPSPNHQ